MPLNEARRSQLDSIIGRMEAAKEADDEIGAVVADFKSKYENEAAPAPGGASASWGAPAAPIPSMSEALLPATTAAKKTGGGLGRQALGLGSDVLSGALRIPSAAARTLGTKMGTDGDHPQSFRESMGQANRGQGPLGEENLISGMIKDPATIPSMLMGGPAAGAVKSGVMGLAKGLAKTAGYGAGAGAVSAGLHQGDRVARGQGVSGGDAALEVGINTVVPAAAKGGWEGAKAGIGGLKTILSKFSEISPEALKAASNPATLAAAREVTQKSGGRLGDMADDLGARTAAMQADEAQAMTAVNARRQQALQSGMLRARLGAPDSKLSDVSAYDAGKGIETQAKAGMQSAGERFGRGQDEILVNRGIGKKGLQFGGPDGNQTPFEQTVDRYLEEAGVGQGGKNYGVIGNVSIPPGAINEIRSMKGVFQTGLNTRDMLDQLRLVDNRLSFGGDNGARLFAAGSQEDLAMKGLRARLADDLEAQIGRAAGKNKNAVVAAWGAHREAYHKTAEAFEKIQDGISAGKVNQETYFSRIKNIGVEDLRKLSAEAKTNPDLAPTWNELRKGFFDNILSSGIKEDGIDYNAIKKTWDAMDDDLKTVMMPTKVISHVDGVLDRTAPIDFKGSTLADKNRWVGRDRQSTLGALQNIETVAKDTDMRDLKIMDDLLGLEGKDRFSEQAKSFYLGKQLGMDNKGKLPGFTGSRNGGRVTGMVLGSTLGGGLGGSQDGAQGIGYGGAAGAIAGVAAQSPAGALALYKLLDKIRKGAVMTERNAIRPAARLGLSSGRLTRGLTTSQFGEQQNK